MGTRAQNASDWTSGCDNESAQAGEHPNQGRGVADEREPYSNGPIVVKIGGSIFGSLDTTLEDLVDIQREGAHPVVVHGGANLISQWMRKRGVRPRFIRGLRVTDSDSLEVVVAVLTGLVNKSLVSSVTQIGGRAIGFSGVDGGMIRAEVKDPALGLVGDIVSVDPAPIEAVISSGFIPIIAPLALNIAGFSSDGVNPFLNVNADTVAGEIAVALSAERLVFTTDVGGVMDSSRRVIPRLTKRQAKGLLSSNVIDGGMIPKISACLSALGDVTSSHIIDGRKPHSLRDVLDGDASGTRVG